MSLAAIGIAKRDGQGDCSSALSIRSRGLQLSMAVSLAAHAALAGTILSTRPMETASLGDPQALQVAFVDLAPMAPAAKIVAPVAQPKPMSAPKVEAAAPEKIKPLPVADRAELAVRTAKKTLEVPRKAAAAQPTPQTSRPAPATSASQSLQMHGAKSAAVAKAGADEAREIVVTTARFRVPPTPAKYPKRAHDLNQQGEALIRARIDFEGNTAEVLVWKSSGFALLDNAALSAVRRWQFMPERRNGMPVVAWVEIPVRFRLN